MSANSDSHLFCIFADDIRQEVGNKLTIIGVYQGGGLTIHGTLPIVLPRLAIIAHLFCPVEKEIKSIKFGIKFNEDLLLPEMYVPDEVIANMRKKASSTQDSAGAGIQVGQIIQPLEIKNPGEIKCYAEVDGELVKGNSLEVQVVHIDAL